MRWYWIISITILIYNIIGVIILTNRNFKTKNYDNEELSAIWSCFFIWLLVIYIIKPIYQIYKKIKEYNK